MIEGLKTTLARLFGLAGPEPPALDEESVLAEFRKRFHNFRLLLTANKKAMRTISAMQSALAGDCGFDMGFVRSQATSAQVNVFRIAKHLNEIAPGRYEALFERLKIIEADIAASLSRQPAQATRKLTLPLEAVTRNMADQVGSKMANLGDILNRTGLPVPPGFAITSLAYSRFMAQAGLRDEINRLFQSVPTGDHAQLLPLCSRVQQMIVSAPLPKDVSQAVLEAYQALEAKTSPGVRVSLRSSALGEDNPDQSFAGLFRSVLNVTGEDLLATYKNIVASKYSPQAVTYRQAKGILDEDTAMCVGCMAMIQARCGGVAYSRDPLSRHSNQVFVHSAWGLAKTVVDGAVDPDLFVIERGPELRLGHSHISRKDRILTCDPVDGVCRLEELGPQAELPSLTPEEALRLGDIAVRLDEAHGFPVDIEWVMDQSGRIYILQCRPLQQTGEEGPVVRQGISAQPLARGGVTGSPGVGAGQVHVVRRDADLLTFPENGVLVSAEASPRWATLLVKAQAVITERGSSAGHLANVAREFGVPALMAFDQAVGLFEDAGVVTVDADARAVYPGRVKALLDLARPKPHLLAKASPLHAVLREVLDHIAPLNLLDPSSPDFTAESCRTLHDITRFAHEKAVWEMFKFGQDFQFSKRASKQLKYKSPMSWWFVNLDDGFTHEIKGKYITLEEIDCQPVQALWAGFVAVPWEGPPPVDTKGFMSILASSATNPNISLASASDYDQGNYFMISKHFMCLNSRFGYHFCTVEALVDERANENYVSFQFQGGAAEQERKRLRAEFIGQILEGYHFRVEIRDCDLQAQFAKGSMDLMLDRLRVIGYLLMHTRQLDMVMTNVSLVESYRQRFHQEIEDLLRKAEEKRMAKAWRELG